MLLMTSCQSEDLKPAEAEGKDTTNDPSTYARSAIEDRPLQEQLDYKEAHLFNIAQFVENHNTTIRAHIKDSVTSTPDSLYPLVFDLKTLFEDTSINYSSIQADFDAFNDLDGQAWYPSLTIPDKSNPITNGNFETTDPVYAISYYDISRSEETATWYAQQNNSLQPIAPIAEEDGYNYFIYYLEIENSPYGGNYGGTPPSSNYRLYIDKMTAKYHKEGWPGRTEVQFQGFQFDNYYPADTSKDCGDHIEGGSNCYTEGRRIKRVKRRHIGDQFNASYTIEDYDESQNGHVIFYVIFEYDGWPASLEYDEWFELPNNNYRRIFWRSWQSKYDKRTLSMDPNNPYGYPFARTFSVNKNSIKYNLN